MTIVRTDLTNTLSSATHNLLQAVESRWSNQKIVGPGLKVYGLATPLGATTTICFVWNSFLSSVDNAGREYSIRPGSSDVSAV